MTYDDPIPPPDPARILGAYLYDPDATPSDPDQPAAELLWSEETVWGTVECYGNRSRWIPITDTPDPDSGLTVRWTEDGIFTIEPKGQG